MKSIFASTEDFKKKIEFRRGRGAVGLSGGDRNGCESVLTE
ncbi:hypothetical protein [Aporhodopirellula aestuarii]|nr:hypothetical protein [Aporhodopirellula aestuarii]